MMKGFMQQAGAPATIAFMFFAGTAVSLWRGVTDFLNYFVRAFPLFGLTSLALLGTWAFTLRGEEDADALRKLAILNLKSQYKNRKTRFDVLARLGAVFAAMFAAWSFIPQETMPPELVAALGYAAAMIVCSLKGMRLNLTMDMKSVLMIASFLFLAEAVSQTGLLRVMALRLQDGIEDQRSLVAVLMVVASLLAGVFSAGPAAAAMMPVIAELCRGPLQAQAHWLAVAYAAAICAGSSLFMWSATAGFILSDKVNGAALEDGSGRKVCWGWREYFGYGVANYLIQISIALAVVLSAF